MKHLIIALVMMAGLSLQAQDTDTGDLRNRTKYAFSIVKTLAKSHPERPVEESYAKYKISELAKVVELSDEQKAKFTELYQKQYEPWKSAWENYYNTDTAQLKVTLIKLLLDQEEETRKILSEKQSIFYKGYWYRDFGDSNFLDFRRFFMPESIYYQYKKELL